LSIAGAAYELGPFFVNAGDDVVFSLQVYWIAISLPILLLAAAIREGQNRAKFLQDQHNQLAGVTEAEMVTELSGVLSNELSQPLTAILANAPAAKLLLARQPISALELRATLSDIEREARQAAKVLGQFRGHARQRAPHFESTDVARLVGDALNLSANILEAARVEVLPEIARDLPLVKADRVQLLQVLLNLIANSHDAMCSVAEPRRLRLRVTQPDPEHVEVVVADTGTGLPNGDSELVFEPFFTTKTGAMGMGLPIARSIACEHGGRVWAEPSEGGGATFHLLLPVEGFCRATSAGG